MGSRVILIDPPLYKDPFWDPVRYAHPLGLVSIASHLQSLGHEVEIISAPGEGWDRQVLVTDPREAGVPAEMHLRRKSRDLARVSSGYELLRHLRDWQDRRMLYVGLTPEEIAERVQRSSPDLIGISLIASCNHPAVMDLVKALRSAGCDVPIVVGGHHATAMPERVLDDADGMIDWVVRGEGEQIMAAIADAPGNREMIRLLPGVCYRDREGHVVKNKRPGFFGLDEIALPDAGILSGIKMPEYPSYTFDSCGRRYVDVMFSVGCHNSCAYCYSPQMRGRLRKHNDGAIRSILEDLRMHGFEELVLQDDDLLSDREGFLHLLNLFREYGFRWQDNGGIELELLDEQLVDEIAASNCTSIYVPVNPRKIADRFPRPEALMKVHLLSRLRRSGIYTFTSGIYGVPNLAQPERAVEEIRAMRDFHVELVDKGFVDASLVFPLSALPGTRWYHEIRRHPEFEFLQDDWLAYSIYVPQIWPRATGRAAFEAELVEVHRMLNQVQTSYPWFSPFPNVQMRQKNRVPA